MDVHPHPGPTITDIHYLDIFHLNSRSIRHKLDNIYDVVDDFHVLCFSETDLDPSIGPDTLEIVGGRVVRWCWVNFQCRGVLQFGLQ